jgi:hypothetical protein
VSAAVSQAAAAELEPNILALSLHPWGIVRRLLTEARDRCHLYSE